MVAFGLAAGFAFAVVAYLGSAPSGAFSIRAALVAAGVVLTPAGALYGRALRHGGVEPELEDLPQAEPVTP